jgi:glutathione peroxidase
VAIERNLDCLLPIFIVALLQAIPAALDECSHESMNAPMNLCRTVPGIVTTVCFLALTVAAVLSTLAENEKKTVYDYSLVAFDGKEVPLSTFKGKVLLVVNLASQSIFKDQIAQLEELQKIYKDKGLLVLGIPSNDFGAQEPGTDADVQKTYGSVFHLSFPVFARASVRGKDQAALYGFLTGDKKSGTGGDVRWSYTKFVVDRAGKVVARFEPDVPPNSPELGATIEEVLAGRFKPPAKKGGDEEKKQATDRSEDRRR